MSRINRYQDSLINHIKKRSSYSHLITPENKLDKLLDMNQHEASIVLLTVLKNQMTKNKMQQHHCYHISSAIDLMMTSVMIKDNINYFNQEFGSDLMKDLLDQTPMHIYDSVSRNIETFQESVDKHKLIKIHFKLISYLSEKLIEISTINGPNSNIKLKGVNKTHKTDIIKYKFSDNTLLDTKYRKLKVIPKDIMIEYVDKTYGAVCKTAFYFGWLLGLGDEKMKPNLERIGTHLGIILKLSNDFMNLERDLKYCDDISTNMFLNYGIHKCFEIFDESKTKLHEGIDLMNIYSITLKEIIDILEKRFDDQLNNTNLDLQSQYTNFSDVESKEPTKKYKEINKE